MLLNHSKRRLQSVLFLLIISIGSASASLNTPALVSPSDGASGLVPNILLDWSAVSGATAYEYRIGTQSNLSAQPAASVTSSQAVPGNLLFGTTFFWQVRAVASSPVPDSSAWSAVWSFTTTDQLNLVGPTDQSTGRPPDQLLDWSALSGVSTYQIQYDTTGQFNSPVLRSETLLATSSQLNCGELYFGVRYYWRVRAYHQFDTTQWSVVWSFTTTDQLNLVGPTDQSTGRPPDQLLDWSALSGVSTYQIQYDTTSQFNSTVLRSETLLATTSQLNCGDLYFGVRYYWRVRAYHQFDTTQWSAVWRFTTTDELYPVAPSNGAINLSASLIIDWSPLSGVTYYEYQYDTDPLFTQPFSGNVFATVSQAGLSGLLTGSTYYWRVRAIHGIDTSGWSATWNFTVGLPTGINSLDTASTFFYPNPSSNYVYLESPAESGVVSLVNVSGEKVLEWELRSFQGRIDVSVLASGYYILQYQYGTENKRAWFIKQ